MNDCWRDIVSVLTKFSPISVRYSLKVERLLISWCIEQSVCVPDQVSWLNILRSNLHLSIFINIYNSGGLFWVCFLCMISTKIQPYTTEVLRGLGESRGPLECSSPLLSNITRKELCQNCEAPFSTGHCCEIYRCDQCGKILGNHVDLSEHEATDHKHVCNHYQCGKKFINHGDVIEHEANFHNNRCNRCDLCNHPTCRGICWLFPKWPIGQFGRRCLHSVN